MQHKAGKKSAWNPSRQLIDQFVLLLNNAESSFYNGRYDILSYRDCFFKTREIRLLISPYLTSDETKQLDRLEYNIRRWWALYRKAEVMQQQINVLNFDSKANKRNLVEARNKHWNCLQRYRYLMNSLANVHGFGISESQDQTRMFG